MRISAPPSPTPSSSPPAPLLSSISQSSASHLTASPPILKKNRNSFSPRTSSDLPDPNNASNHTAGNNEEAGNSQHPPNEGKDPTNNEERIEPDTFIDNELEPYFHKINNAQPYKTFFWDSEVDKPKQGQLNFVGEDPKLGPICVSVIKEKSLKSKNGRFRVLIWTKEGCFTRFLPSHSAGSQLRGEVLAELVSLKFSPISNLTCIHDLEDRKSVV